MDTDAIVDRLKATPLWRQATAEARTALIAERTAAADRLAKAQAEHDKRLPGLLKARDKARAKAHDAWEGWQLAEAERGSAERALADASSALDRVRGEVERYLRASADETVDEFRRELEREFEAHRHEGVETEGGGYNRITGQPIPPKTWNLPSRRAWASAVLSAIQACDALKLITDPSDLDAEIERVRASIPDPAEMVKFRKEAA